MSSLWTPDGEHKVDRSSAGGDDAVERETRPRPQAAEQRPEPDDVELDEIRRQLVEAPVEVVIANHAYGLFELAALHLSAQPPGLEQARLAVDALGVLIEGLSARLGQGEPQLKEALAQIRLAYVQISGMADAEQPA